MPNQRQIKLELPGNSLINCFGIQPVLVSGEVPQRISLFSINRYTKWKDNATTNSIYYTPKLYTGWDARIVYDKAVTNKIADLYGLNVIINAALHIKINKSLNELKKNSKELRSTLLYYSELLKYKNRMNKGNFFITSDDEIYNNIKFAARQLNRYNKYKVSSDILEENLIIIGAKGNMNFDNPIMAVPFIDETDFRNFLRNRGIKFKEEIQLNKSGLMYPVVDYYQKQYEKYQLYLNEKEPLKWHLEKFLYPEMFYLVIHLNP